MAARKPVPAGGAPATETNPAATAAETSAPASAPALAPASGDVPATSETPAVADAPATAADTLPAIDPDELIEARVLVAFDGYEPNDIITAPAGDISRLVKAGRVDDDADAVTAALEMQA